MSVGSTCSVCFHFQKGRVLSTFASVVVYRPLPQSLPGISAPADPVHVGPGAGTASVHEIKTDTSIVY